ncbi:MAG: hypothetical protein V4515_12300 [Chloroflexota bacterium]
MTAYFKCTRPDGTDFRTGTVDYAAALVSGEVIRHPATMVKDEASTYLSVSVEPADCTGFEWPCRLFRVEPVGRTLRASNLTNKRACRALRVVEELPSHMAFGPNGEAVAAFLEALAKLTPEQVRRLAAARAAARAAAWAAARYAARDAARDAAWYAARDAARAARAAAPAAAPDAALTIVVRDLITPEQYAILVQPFVDAELGELVA